MNGLLILISVSILFFTLITIARKWADSFTLIAVAIGCAINANIYNQITTPVVVGNLTFGIDSILYTAFIFVTAIKFLHYSIKEAKTMVYSTIVAILISALIELCAGFSSYGYTLEGIQQFLSYVTSGISSLIAIWVMVMVMNMMKKHSLSNYLILPVMIFVACFINSILYQSSLALIQWQLPENYLLSSSANIIGKVFATILAELSYFISNKYLYPNELIKK